VGQTEEYTLCWFTNGDFWQFDWLMGFIPRNGDCCLWFDKWRLLLVWLIDGFYPEKWRLPPVIWLMATSACGLINGVSCLWFDLWWLMPMVWLMASLTCGLSDDDFCQAFDEWALPFSGLISGFTPTVIWFISNNIIPQWRLPSVCTAMSIRLPSYLSSLVNFTCYIESSKSYIHTVIYSYIHSYTYSCI